MWLRISIDDVLNVWCRRWASQRDIKGYPSLQPFMREAKRKVCRYAIEDLGDESYLRIDEAVDVLRQRELVTYQILMVVFLQLRDKKEICAEMGISPRTFDERLKNGRMFMEGAVFGSDMRVKF